ncbi:unnamed protein product [Didymodactylos carnosus]|uniref:Lethal giant larvae homologue 2 domain-containing protein n=1 Tax=Didymodactylos carnosus TaxID=1234261 RepID=A0A8S2D103_9BILA|nr:unnamed protein product [Didymodactylos carnosus]CAF3602362.1 unnamed protein product [Didymodactylos carnosus]
MSMTSRIRLPFKLGDSKKTEVEISENLRKEDFSLSEIVRYGFPYKPTTLAYDPVQKLLAIGTRTGSIKIYGGAFVECCLPHPTEVEIVQLVFRINEGALISACRDNYIHLWSLRQKKPVIASSLKFVKEKISRCLLPLSFNSKWLLVGTYFGNVYVVNLDTFTLSSYKIMWNNAIGMGKSTHPGVVVDLCQNPEDPTKIYIGFSTHITAPNAPIVGHVVCWNFVQKVSESVYTLSQGLTSISWHHEARQFMCSHCDGSLSVWNLKATDKPLNINYPHARICKDDVKKFGSVNKVMWSAIKNTDTSFIIFSGGMPHTQQQPPSSSAAAASSATPPAKPSSHFLTIIRGQTTNVLHMDNSIVDFHVLSSSPHVADVPDPSAVVVLLENDLVVIDLKTENYPLFESLHTMDLHESQVTYCDYLTEPNANFYQSLLRLQSKQTPKRTFSQQENPISGGKSGNTIFGYNELIITGHADGSIKFWDASGVNLVFLYKLRTNRLFDRVYSKDQPSKDVKTTRSNSSNVDEQGNVLVNGDGKSDPNDNDQPFAIYSIKLCCDGQLLTAVGRGGHVTLFKFSGSELDKVDEGLGDLPSLEVPILHRNSSGLLHDQEDTGGGGGSQESTQIKQLQHMHLTDKKEFKSLLRAKFGYRRMAGYQPELVCLLSWLPTDKVPTLTDTAINSKYGLMVFGFENGLVVIDYLSKSILMNMATADLYGTMDPFQRATLSPKRKGPLSDVLLSTDDPTSVHDHQPQTPIPPQTAEIHSFTGILKSHGRGLRSKRISNDTIGQPNVSRSRSIDLVSIKQHGDQEETKANVSQQQRFQPVLDNQQQPQTGTIGKTLKKFRSHLSRSSVPTIKNPAVFMTPSNDVTNQDNDSPAHSGAESEGSVSENQKQFIFSEIQTSNSDLTAEQQQSQLTPLTPDQSLSSDEKFALQSTSSIPSTIINNPSSSDTSQVEPTTLSKTWSPSMFTTTQLRGTCSLEYCEHIKSKTNKRKINMVDLRKDLPTPPSTATPTNTSMSKSSFSSSYNNNQNNNNKNNNSSKDFILPCPNADF